MSYSYFNRLFLLVFAIGTFSAGAIGQTTLIDFNFQSNALPAEITSNGVISPTKAADGVCSKGMMQVNSGQYLQASVSSCGLFTVNMKSTSSSARTVTVKYKKDGDADFSVATTSLSVSTAATFDLTALYPVLKSSVPIIVSIEPTSGNIQIHDILVQSSTTLSTDAEITTFKIPNQIGNEVINSGAATIAINVPLGTSLTSVVPSQVSISSQATIRPAVTSAQNFTNPVNYTVTAQDGITSKIWRVSVTAVASSLKEITEFKLSDNQLGNAVINSAAGTIAVNMPVGSNLSSIVPVQLTLSPNATINPTATTALEFSSPVVYTVTAENNSTKQFTVTVSLVDPSEFYTSYEAEDAEYTGTKATNHNNYSGTGFIDFLSSGDNYIIYTVCEKEAGTQAAKFRYSLANDETRRGALYVNDDFVKYLDFPRTTTFDVWAEETAAINLVAGVNKIKITWDTTDAPNMDKLMLSGTPCNTYSLSLSATNGGTVSVSPQRNNNSYFEGETATLFAQGTPSIQFTSWSGDLTGNTNPSVVTFDANKTIVANFNVIPTYKLNVTINGIGEVELDPAGGEYAENTVVTLTPKSILGSTFTGWSGDLTGTSNPATITMTTAKNVTANFSSSYTFNFEKVIGFASAAGDGFTGPTTGGQCAADTVTINGPAEFNKLCETLYNRQQAFKNGNVVGGIKKAPLVIMLKGGTYDGTQALSTNGAKIFGNSMLDIPEQADISVVGETNVVFKIGINVKRSYNVLIRNITFQDYYDDGVNIGGTFTHHIWVDHCTFGNPVGFPANSEHPDGGCDIKDGASYVTVSWCIFRNSYKTSLVGHSDNNGSTDIGRLKVTYVNNHFVGTNSRNPRVRFGEVHVLNNLSERVQLYGIAAANSAWVYAENNFYLNTDWPMYADRTSADFKAVFGNNSDNTYTSKTGNYPANGLKQTGNEYDDSGLPVITAQIKPSMLNPGGRSVKFDELNPENVFNPSTYYEYTPLPASAVRVIVPLYAGADKVQFTNGCSTLPLQLLMFNASLQAGSKEVLAVWQTTDEVNTKNFVVERSINAKDFSPVGELKARNIAGINEYAFTDRNAFKGTSYYRLKLLDKDGRNTLSKVVTINNRSGVSLAVYPNPSKGQASISHPAAVKGSVIKVVTMFGQTVMLINPVQSSGATTADISKLASGSYMIVYEAEGEKLFTKFVKQ